MVCKVFQFLWRAEYVRSPVCNTVALFIGVQSPKRQPWGFYGGLSPRISHLKQIKMAFLDAEFNVGYCFAVKFGLAERHCEVMDAWSWGTKMTKKAWPYLKHQADHWIQEFFTASSGMSETNHFVFSANEN